MSSHRDTEGRAGRPKWRGSYDQGRMETGPTRVAFLGVPPDEGRIMDLRRPLIVALGVVAMFGVASASADAAITISRAELSGTQLRVEGSGAVPNHAVTVI